MNIEQEIRQQIEKNKGLKLEIGEINNHLSILEGMCRNDYKRQIEEAYQKGLTAGYSDGYDARLKDGKEQGLDEADMREAVAYEKGLNEAWEAARKISLMPPDEIEKVFPGAAKYNRYNLGYSAAEAIAKLKAYEEQKKVDEEIKVGDEVIYNEHKFIVFATETDECYASLIDRNGRHESASHEDLKKTGKHYNIDKILEEMKE